MLLYNYKAPIVGFTMANPYINDLIQTSLQADGAIYSRK